MREYDLSSIKRRKEKDENDNQYESFNISKELSKLRKKVQEKKDRKRYGY